MIVELGKPLAAAGVCSTERQHMLPTQTAHRPTQKLSYVMASFARLLAMDHAGGFKRQKGCSSTNNWNPKALQTVSFVSMLNLQECKQEGRLAKDGGRPLSYIFLQLKGTWAYKCSFLLFSPVRPGIITSVLTLTRREFGLAKLADEIHGLSLQTACHEPACGQYPVWGAARGLSLRNPDPKSGVQRK